MASAIVLAGGQSRRMGQDKATLVVAGRTLLEHVLGCVSGLVDEIVVVKRPEQTLPALDIEARVVDDALPGTGPLGGLCTGLQAVSSLPALAVACDMPLLQRPLLAELLVLAEGFDAAAPTRFGDPEPLCAAYNRGSIEVAQARLQRGELRLTEFVEALQTRYLDEEEWREFDLGGLSFFNVNTPEDLERAEKLLGKRP